MSIYDQRNEPAYRDDFKAYNNKNIDKWWSTSHDELITTLIETYQWHWYWEISDLIASVTPEDVMEALMQQRNWYNKVMYYAQTRANTLGLTANIRTAKEKKCPLCKLTFIESSLPHPFVKRLGIENLDFCSPCLKEIVLRNTGKNDKSKEEIIQFLKKLAEIIGVVPTQSFGEGLNDFSSLNFDKRFELLTHLCEKPTLNNVKVVFGSWFKALIEAELLEDGARKTPRGIQSLSLDGHMCFSLGEKTIDDYLFKNNIEHEREPNYPESNFRADFKVGSIFIEYFGLTGNVEYDKKTNKKKRLCKKHNISLISLFPKDLVTIAKLEKKLLPLTKYKKPNKSLHLTHLSRASSDKTDCDIVS